MKNEKGFKQAINGYNKEEVNNYIDMMLVDFGTKLKEKNEETVILKNSIKKIRAQFEEELKQKEIELRQLKELSNSTSNSMNLLKERECEIEKLRSLLKDMKLELDNKESEFSKFKVLSNKIKNEIENKCDENYKLIEINNSMKKELDKKDEEIDDLKKQLIQLKDKIHEELNRIKSDEKQMNDNGLYEERVNEKINNIVAEKDFQIEELRNLLVEAKNKEEMQMREIEANKNLVRKFEDMKIKYEEVEGIKDKIARALINAEEKAFNVIEKAKNQAELEGIKIQEEMQQKIILEKQKLDDEMQKEKLKLEEFKAQAIELKEEIKMESYLEKRKLQDEVEKERIKLEEFKLKIAEIIEEGKQKAYIEKLKIQQEKEKEQRELFNIKEDLRSIKFQVVDKLKRYQNQLEEIIPDDEESLKDSQFDNVVRIKSNI